MAEGHILHHTWKDVYPPLNCAEPLALALALRHESDGMEYVGPIELYSIIKFRAPLRCISEMTRRSRPRLPSLNLIPAQPQPCLCHVFLGPNC